MPVKLKSSYRNEEYNLLDIKSKCYRYFECLVEHVGVVKLEEYLEFIFSNIEVIEDTFEVSVQPYADLYKKETPVTTFKYLKVTRCFDVDRRTGKFDDYYDFSGWGPSEGEGNSNDVNWGLDFQNINQLWHCEVKLASPKIVDYNDEKIYYGSNECNRTYNLYDVLHAIVNELFFFESPYRRDDVKDELDCRIEEVESGTAELIPFEDVKEKLNMKEYCYKIWYRNFKDTTDSCTEWVDWQGNVIDTTKTIDFEIIAYDSEGRTVLAGYKNPKE